MPRPNNMRGLRACTPASRRAKGSLHLMTMHSVCQTIATFLPISIAFFGVFDVHRRRQKRLNMKRNVSQQLSAQVRTSPPKPVLLQNHVMSGDVSWLRAGDAVQSDNSEMYVLYCIEALPKKGDPNGPACPVSTFLNEDMNHSAGAKEGECHHKAAAQNYARAPSLLTGSFIL